ncbi:excalibur calcium-binding domain-containing protein [Nocardia amamiensis]|uniref:Excalibur calcium-binding domain-containing protein n=1 Tax=Nocardia amamiensis TaxID=404578 RepID=A0ABS0CIE7_9NOCA|nr:excalibur calcium-binding domain-containing protein [Nocardia amamiensis]MBF6296377.1 excalibur calcium-binding domain-containing protein [Nocardia amamiensis]
MKTTLLRTVLGIASACLLTIAVLVLGLSVAAAEPGDAAPTYYKNCAAVRDAGKAPLLRGEPGYAPHLDRDNDGIACE